MDTLPDAGRRPAAYAILAIATAAWMSVPLRLLVPGNELDFGFTVNNAIFVIENAAMAGTVVLAVGAAALRARRLLIGAVVVTCLHLLFQLGTAVVQLVNGARPDLILGTLIAIIVLVVAAAGVLLALLLPSSRSARRTGLIVALTGALVHTLWTNVLAPVVAMLSYGSLPPGMVESLLLSVLLSLLVVAAAALCGWAAPMARRIGAVLATVVGLLGFLATFGSFGALGRPYAAVQAVDAVLMLAAAAVAVVAGRRLAAPATPDAVAAEA